MVETPVSRVSMIGLSPVTVTVSCTVDSSSCALTCARNPMVTRMSCWTMVRNPGSPKVTEYVPIGSSGTRYVPASAVVTMRGWIKAGPATVTVTPGSTALELSVTRPRTSPVCCCADMLWTIPSIRTTAAIVVRRFILPPQSRRRCAGETPPCWRPYKRHRMCGTGED